MWSEKQGKEQLVKTFDDIKDAMAYCAKMNELKLKGYFYIEPKEENDE